MVSLLHWILLVTIPVSIKAATEPTSVNPPYIIMVMADDLGWGDVGFNGNPIIKTPKLDAMASNGLQFTRFYSGAPVCSPTRGSCLTGRNAERYGIFSANVGHIKPQEYTLAEILKTKGYATGHFGKWYLGTLSRTVRDGNRGAIENEHYSPPWENGFDVCFSTEQAVPTWDPMINQHVKTHYWTGPNTFAKDNLEGDDSRVILDRVIPFIEASTRQKKPFLAVVWFHTPHSPVVAGQKYRDMYPGLDENHQHYYGCITAMDEQVGRLRRILKKMGISENTILFFASDNGPAGEGNTRSSTAFVPGKRNQGSSGPFRSRKGSLNEGGVRVPAVLEWPREFKQHRKVCVPLTTSDYLPTILSLVGYDGRGIPHPLDGVDMMPLLTGEKPLRLHPIAFQSYEQRALIDDRFKLYSPDDGNTYQLYDLLNDPSEASDIAKNQPELVNRMRARLDEWVTACKKSDRGEDYRE